MSWMLAAIITLLTLRLLVGDLTRALSDRVWRRGG